MDELRRPESAQKIALETRLLAQVAAGGSARDVAMRALFDAYQTKFLKGLKWSGLPLEIAQEVMQEVWIAVMKKAADFRPGTAPSSWLWGFVENARHDALRKWLRPARHERSDNDEAIAAEVDKSMSYLAAASPESAHALDDMRRCVQTAFLAFKRQHANDAWLLYVRHVEDWELEQVAKYRQSKLHAAAQSLVEARRKFRPLIQPCLGLRRV